MRFRAVVRLNTTRTALHEGRIADEVIAYPAAPVGADVEITLIGGCGASAGATVDVVGREPPTEAAIVMTRISCDNRSVLRCIVPVIALSSPDLQPMPSANLK